MGTTDQFDRLNDAIKDSGKDFNSFFVERLKSFIKTDVAGDLGAFWDDLAAKERETLKAAKEIGQEMSALVGVGIDVLSIEKEKTEESKKQLSILGKIEAVAYNTAKAIGMQLGYRKQIVDGAAKQLGIDADVESQTTEDLKLDLQRRKAQKREVDLAKREKGAFRGLAEAFDQAALATQITRLENELKGRSDVARLLSSFGKGMLLDRGYSVPDINRLSQANESSFAALSAGRDEQYKKDQSRILGDISKGIANINRTTSKLDSGLQ